MIGTWNVRPRGSCGFRGSAIFHSEVKTISFGPMKAPSNERLLTPVNPLKRNEVVLRVGGGWRSAIPRREKLSRGPRNDDFLRRNTHDGSEVPHNTDYFI